MYWCRPNDPGGVVQACRKHTLNHVGAFDYLTELQRHAAELRTDPAAWMPWNYQANLAKAAPG
jgi:hypothetical protein